jgi:hypothetical protein
MGTPVRNWPDARPTVPARLLLLLCLLAMLLPTGLPARAMAPEGYDPLAHAATASSHCHEMAPAGPMDGSDEPGDSCCGPLDQACLQGCGCSHAFPALVLAANPPALPRLRPAPPAHRPVLAIRPGTAPPHRPPIG